MKVLLHTCCAPCMTYPMNVLSERGYQVVPFFYNPNVHPFSEYRKRYFAVLDYCRGQGLDVEVGPYEMERFLLEISPRVDNRCELCFRIRLSRAARHARTLGIGEFTSTLLVSPYQDQMLIRAAGEAAAIEHGVLFLFEDMRKGYQETVSKSRELDIYRQSYCGCLYSEKERYQKGDPPTR